MTSLDVTVVLDMTCSVSTCPCRMMSAVASWPRGRKEWFEQRPFGIGQISWQSQVDKGILRLGGVDPHR